MELLHNLAVGFGIALTPANLFFALAGALIGTLIGVLPGIGPIATIAMLLPLTFHLEPTSGLIMLAGIFYGAQYGGSMVSTGNANNWDSFCSNAVSTSFASSAVSVFLAGSASPAQVVALSCEASPAISLRRRSRRAADSSVRRTIGLLEHFPP